MTEFSLLGELLLLTYLEHIVLPLPKNAGNLQWHILQGINNINNKLYLS